MGISRPVDPTSVLYNYVNRWGRLTTFSPSCVKQDWRCQQGLRICVDDCYLITQIPRHTVSYAAIILVCTEDRVCYMWRCTCSCLVWPVISQILRSAPQMFGFSLYRRLYWLQLLDGQFHRCFRACYLINCWWTIWTVHCFAWHFL